METSGDFMRLWLINYFLVSKKMGYVLVVTITLDILWTRGQAGLCLIMS